MIIIARDFEQIIKRPIINEANQREEAIEENIRNDSLVFTRAGYVNPLARLKRSTLVRVGYVFSKNNLIRQHWYALDRQDNANLSERVLLTNVASVKWRFADENNNFYNIWPPVADMRTELPRAIEMTLNIKNWGTITRVFSIPEHSYEVSIAY